MAGNLGGVNPGTADLCANDWLMFFMFGAWVVRRTLQQLRLTRKCRTQRFACAYQVTLTNHAPAAAAVTVAYPVPPELPYQRVSSLKIIAPGHTVVREQVFGNQCVVVPIVVPGQGSVHVGLGAEITVHPRNTSDRVNQLPTPSPATPATAISAAVRALAERVASSRTDEFSIIRRCYDYVVTQLTYGNPIEGLYTADDALRLPCVDCGGFSSLLGAMLAARGIPSRLLVGFETGFPNGLMHAWLEARLADGRWVVLDPSVDYLSRRGRTRRLGGFGSVGSDRIVFSIGSDFILPIASQKVAVRILQHPLVLPRGVDGLAVQLAVSSRRL